MGKECKCLGETSFVILNYTEQQAQNCLKYFSGLCASGGVCTVMFGAENQNKIKNLDSL